VLSEAPIVRFCQLEALDARRRLTDSSPSGGPTTSHRQSLAGGLRQLAP
jgi:hypothetical protein